MYPCRETKGAAVSAGHEDSVTAAAIASCGKRAITISDDGTARCWVRLACRGSVVVCESATLAVGLAWLNFPVYQSVTTTSLSCSNLSAAGCALQDLVSGACRAVLRLGGVPGAVRLSGDDSLCVILTGEQAAVYNFSTARQTARLAGHTSAVTDAAISADAASVLTVSEDATLRLWSAQTGASWAACPAPRMLSDLHIRILDSSCDAVGMHSLDHTPGGHFARLQCR